jgi:hypothetical protein
VPLASVFELPNFGIKAQHYIKVEMRKIEESLKLQPVLKNIY